MLSDHERSRLEGVARDLLADDPDFVRTFHRDENRLGRDRPRGTVLVAAGIAAVFGSLLWIAGAPGGAVAVAVTVALIWIAWRYSTGDNPRRLR